MKDGFIRVAAISPDLRVADAHYNADEIVRAMRAAAEADAQLLVLPELSLTGYTASDLLLQDALLQGALEGLETILDASRESDLLVIVGMPIADGNCLYDCGVAIKGGEILGAVPKTHVPNYGEFYELRHFAPAFEGVRTLRLLGREVPFGADLIFACEELPQLRVALEIGEEFSVPNPPGARHALAGATVLCNPAAGDDGAGRAESRRALIAAHASRLAAACVHADAGAGESTQDLVFAAHNLIAENGRVLAESPRYADSLLCAEIDLRFLEAERRRKNAFREPAAPHTVVPFHLDVHPLELRMPVDPMPFVPADPARRAARCEEILAIQAHGLAKRVRHTHCKALVVGVSGGLDSTLAMLVAARALQIEGLPADCLQAVTMPCFGTTNRTHDNAVKLSRALGAQLKEVNIEKAVRQHFADIGLDESARDVTYENAQARERTQVLMDLANMSGGMVVGTGDLSELALGWATYNGDHMSMYGVNCSVPKTLIRHLVAHVAESCGDAPLREVLTDVLDTPVSPELLPPSDGEISQKTEDLVGPYELHDFFLYHMIRRGATPGKILRLARIAFAGRYGDETVEKWLSTFVRRFFAQQFKRSCAPDGPKVGSVSLSPRGDWRMPSDTSGELWRI